MIKAWNIYNTSNNPVRDLRDVIEYNKFDCTCLHALLEFVRTKMMKDTKQQVSLLFQEVT